MATETIYKLQPHRTMHLRGFDRHGAAASLHDANETGFQVSGVFRDMADFAVLMLYDADDYFGHWQTTKYLPDFDFTGMVLSFNLGWVGVQAPNSKKYNWIDWASLDATKRDGSPVSVRLADHAVPMGTPQKATTTLTLSGLGASDPLSPWLHLTLWYRNLAFDWWGDGVTSPTVATVLSSLASQINGHDWTGDDCPLEATAAGAFLTINAKNAGEDGNHATLYAISNSYNLTGNFHLTGGSDTALTVTIDFSACGLADIRQLWMTFAPALPVGTDYADTEWGVAFDAWSVTDPNGKRPLKIAGPGSVRVGSRDSWVSYSGSSWAEEASNQPGGTGWFSGGFAHRANATGDHVTIRYSCQHTHDLYLGTSLYKDRGIVSVTLDGVAQPDVDLFTWTEPPLVTRRVLSRSVAAGDHVVTITVKGTKHAKAGAWDNDSLGTYFYFDFLEAAVLSDVQDPVATYTAAMPATDFDTDHGYKLSPQRLVWMLDRMGFRGALDHYLGVFWWNQRKRVGATWPTKTVTFGGTWAAGESAFITISGFTMGKSVFGADTPDSIAQHFAAFINGSMIGVYATASGGVLTIKTLSPEWSWTYSQSFTSAAGTMVAAGALDGGVEGTWFIDDSATPVLNRAATDWHYDFWYEVAAKGWTAVASFSMELVDPPDDPAGGKVYAQRFKSGTDGIPVQTDTGFGGLKSTQCTFNATVRAYQQQAFKEMAGMMNTAGLTPWLQFGEFLWWFFPGANPSDTKGMAFYDADTAAAAVAALGRPLATFTHPDDDPAVNGYADANFLAGRIKAHTDAISAFVKATYPTAKFEILLPYDVNYPTATPIAQLGGRLLRYVNVPAAFQAKAGSGLDRIKMEGLAFGATERSFAQAQETIRLPYTSPFTWSKVDTAYLFGWFNGGCPWPLEYLFTLAEGIPLVNMWALDHLCLMSIPLPLPKPAAVARVL